MHPLGTYLAITHLDRANDRVGPGERFPQFARVDASPIDEPARVQPATRIGRLAGLVRRLVVRTAGA